MGPDLGGVAFLPFATYGSWSKGREMPQMDSSGALGARIRNMLEERSVDLARQWLDELLRRLPESPQRIFPEQTLLNHVPMLLRRLAEAFEGVDPTEHADVLDELHAMAQLRRSQGYAVGEIVQEFSLLGEIVGEAIEEACLTHAGASVRDAFIVVRQLQKALDQMVQITVKSFGRGLTTDLTKRSQLLDEFGRAISHELRNRLNAASLAVHLCRERARQHPDGQELVDDLHRLRRRIDAISGVVPDVFAVAVAHGRVDPDGVTVFPFSQLVTELVGALEPFARERGVEVITQPDLPTLLVDASRVRMILVNLLSNAIKYSDPEKAESWVRITGELVDDGNAVLVHVSDNGIGIPVVERERIFELYHRGEAVKNREGHGMGLSLARQAAEQINAKLWLSDDAQTTFCVRVPRPAEELDPQRCLVPN